jgi:hypothetical protein
MEVEDSAALGVTSTMLYSVLEKNGIALKIGINSQK